MVAALAILMVVVILLAVVIPLLLRSWVMEESRTDARLHDPRTHTLAYAVPNGVDPVVVTGPLNQAGFTTVLDRLGDAECVLVECTEAERSRVRSVIEAIHVSQYDGPDVSPGRVLFEDERLTR